jgi:hypothetical protein
MRPPRASSGGKMARLKRTTYSSPTPQYNVGVQIKTIYEVKELDNDFFEGE